LTDRAVFGIDLGATTVRLGAFDPSGALIQNWQGEIHARQGPQKGLERIAGLVEGMQARLPGYTLVGIGIGATGPTDPYRGMILNPLTMPGWIDVPIAAHLEGRFRVPVCLENDADAAALGEFWRGAARRSSDEPPARTLYAVTVGTGIGTACIIDGEVYRGADGFHPEGGHQIVDPSGPACYCGAHGCWEVLSSGSAIARQARLALAAVESGAGEHSPILLQSVEGRIEQIEARTVLEAARQGDPLALRVVQRAAQAFAAGIFNIMMLFHPEMIVLSGGVMRSLDLFQPAIDQAVQNASGYIPSRRITIQPASLGYLAGIYGAAYAILHKIDRKILQE